MNTLEEVVLAWKHPKFCPPPQFPIIYLECENAFECRGFLEIEHLAGDVDFSGYPLRGSDLVIDSLGNMCLEKSDFERYYSDIKVMIKILML